MMKKIILLVYLGVVFLDCSYGADNESEIVLVHAIFRHGERTPSRFYPNDPYKNETFHPIGLGGLTNNGKLIMFRLGEIIRTLYDTLLGDEYYEDKVYVRSRFVTRTKISALLVLAGMWPPNNSQKWHPTLNWQPISVDYKNEDEEDLLNPVCTTLKEELNSLYKNSTIEEKYIQQHRKLFDYIENNTGLVLNDFRDIARVYFTLKTESDNGLDLPEWTRLVYPEPLHELAAFLYVYRNMEQKYKIMNSGHLMKKILNDSFAKINNTLKPADRKIFLYSGHETTIGHLLFNLNVFKLEVPDYGNALLVELHKKEEEYFIKLRYLRTPLNATIEDLTIPNCETLCPIDRFKELQADYLPFGPYKQNCF